MGKVVGGRWLRVCGGGLRGGFGDGGEECEAAEGVEVGGKVAGGTGGGCATSVGRLRQVVDAMAVEMHAGLASEGGSKLKMLLTYVHKLPTGISSSINVPVCRSVLCYLVVHVLKRKERGTYYALDLGTSYRVLRVQLGGQRSAIIGHDLDRQPIPQNLMTSTSEELFDFVATLLKDFVEREEKGSISTQQESRELGFTFSFPVGRDVSECLQQAISRKGLDMRVAVLINDTVGTLALGHYDDEDTVAAVIFGTGTNACYLERADAIIKCQGLLTTSGGMVVNMEWGNFWSSHLPRTSYDIDLDGDSPNPNDQIPDVPLNVRRLVVNICDVVTRRAARLAAAGIVGILKKIGRDGSGGIAGGKTKVGSKNKMRRTVVAVEGGLYTNYTMFREFLNEAMEEILGEDVAPYVVIKMTKDGSGIGAALLAASHSASSTVDRVELP
ncbi:Hexokinase-3 [Sesamum angolense]|uniref:Phosphotransferase n=1 Tax=Sesamum angolense TaxID=2727404 RepID=A0AAE1XAJ9_9LAMI|nr:Hexokinase-3 [Sesamum angolense]